MDLNANIKNKVKATITAQQNDIGNNLGDIGYTPEKGNNNKGAPENYTYSFESLGSEIVRTTSIPSSA